MEVFLDSADLNEIRELEGFSDGLTTNPSLIAKLIAKSERKGQSKEDQSKDLVTEICTIMKGRPVSVEVIADRYEEMIKEGLELAKISDNIIVKLPLTRDGLISCKRLLTEHNIRANITLCFSPGQALLAAKAGACFISPFVGRLDDVGYDGLSLIKDMRTIYSNYKFDTKILVASVRSPAHVVEAAKLGADSITMPAKILRQLIKHPLTDQGLAIFKKDWNEE